MRIRHAHNKTGVAIAALVVGAFLCATASIAVKTRFPEGAVRGYPIIRDASGKTIGVSTFTQNIVKGGIIKIVVETRYADGRRVEERMSFKPYPEITQLDWSVEEKRGDDVLRKFAVDMNTGHASYVDEGKAKETTLAHTQGAFAGGGLMFAAKNALPELAKGQTLDVQFVGFMPSPHVVKLTLSRADTEKLAIGGRSIEADKIIVHPDVPSLAKLFVKAPDTVLWFSHSSPPAILRADTTELLPSDPPVHIELLGSP